MEAGGGPSNEHNYTTGFVYQYLLTGQSWAKEAVISLADWVMRMDSGALTVFRWLSRADTGLASCTRSSAYHGPGRGAGNSIVTLLNAFRLTGNRPYLEKVEALIRRCVHPADDPGDRNLPDAENRWSYTVFLVALARYLDDKALLGELDCRFAYARDSLLTYARWMAQHEYPFLEKPEILEHPNETWAAQDMRKSDVFLYASRHTTDNVERARFLERADYFYQASLDWLYRFDTRSLARPVVLMLSLGFVPATRRRGGIGSAPTGPADCTHPPPTDFIPQKQVAMSRARVLLGGAAVTILATLGWLLLVSGAR
jgi:hypothetical protein